MGILAKKTMSEDITASFHFCTDLLQRCNTHTVGVKTNNKAFENWLFHCIFGGKGVK